MHRVLVVDDDPLVRQLLRDMLQTAGCTVDEAVDGNDGLACCARLRYDLVIVDLLMPRKDGLQMIAELRRIDPGSTILALTGYLTDKMDLLKAATEIGADDVSRKPFDVPVFLSQVHVLLAKRHADSRIIQARP